MLKPLVPPPRRLLTIAIGTALAALCIVLLLGRAAATATVAHVCSATDRQFLAIAHSNLAQLGFWSAELESGDAASADVASQAFSEARQVGATRPLDPTLAGVRILIGGVLEEYGRAMRAKAQDRGDGHMRRSWRLAAEARSLLSAAQPQLAALGCDVSPLLG